MTSDSLMPPTPGWMTLTVTSLLRQLRDLVLERLDEPATSPLMSRLSSSSSPALDVLEDVLERALAARAARLLLLSCRRCARSSASGGRVRSFSTTRTKSPASGTPSNPSTSTGSPGSASLDPLAAVVVHRAHAAPVRARHERVADVQRAALHEQRHDRAAARVELGLDDDAGGLGVRVRLELLEVGDDAGCVSSRSSRPCLRLGRDVDELRVAAPLGGVQAALGHLGADAVGVARPPCRSC